MNVLFSTKDKNTNCMLIDRQGTSISSTEMKLYSWQLILSKIKYYDWYFVKLQSAYIVYVYELFMDHYCKNTIYKKLYKDADLGCTRFWRNLHHTLKNIKDMWKEKSHSGVHILKKCSWISVVFKCTDTIMGFWCKFMSLIKAWWPKHKI